MNERTNAMSVDVEDFHNVVARDHLGQSFPPTEAVVRNTRRLLELFAAHGARATFFVLGEVARRWPVLIGEIAGAGHELAVHGDTHRLLSDLTPEGFRQEVVRARAELEDLSGRRVIGHRAPAFSLLPRTRWGLEVLAELGFVYDSSIVPAAGRRYGWPGTCPEPYLVHLESGRALVEVPLTTVRVPILGGRMPACGGGSLRHATSGAARWAWKRARQEGPVVVYIHPYDIDGSDPVLAAELPASLGLRRRLSLSLWLRAQRRARDTVLPKLEEMLSATAFGTIAELVAAAGLRPGRAT